MLPLLLLNFGICAALLFVLSKVAAASLPLAWKLVVALPIAIPLSAAGLMIWQPPNPSDGPDALWRYRPTGIKLNPAHPTARKLLLIWAVLGVVWLLALAEAGTHRLSHWFGGL